MTRRRGSGPLAGQIGLPFNDHEETTDAVAPAGHVAAERTSTAGSASSSVPAVAVAEDCARPVGVGGRDHLPPRSETSRQGGADDSAEAGLGSAEPHDVQVTVPDWVPASARADYMAGWLAGRRAAATAGPLPDEVARDVVAIIDGASQSVQAADAA